MIGFRVYRFEAFRVRAFLSYIVSFFLVGACGVQLWVFCAQGLYLHSDNVASFPAGQSLGLNCVCKETSGPKDVATPSEPKSP